ncbi:uncharacterized protein LOC101238921 isoform X2 [Hydra vulgaris]|uniref:uncharacterized protein LOC101238921 isoform X2 n=1 Tax=Hydra vulgaris TaxID=6087 RepID=UPI0032EA1978
MDEEKIEQKSKKMKYTEELLKSVIIEKKDPKRKRMKERKQTEKKRQKEERDKVKKNKRNKSQYISESLSSSIIMKSSVDPKSVSFTLDPPVKLSEPLSSDVIIEQQKAMISIEKEVKSRTISKLERRKAAFEKITKKTVDMLIDTKLKTPKKKTVLEKMESNSTKSGPMRVLYDSVKEGHKIKVWIRRYNGLRGVVSGYLIAFDFHMNLAMIDVCETYTIETWMVGQPVRNKKKKKDECKTVTSTCNYTSALNFEKKSAENVSNQSLSSTTIFFKALTEKLKSSRSDSVVSTKPKDISYLNDTVMEVSKQKYSEKEETNVSSNLSEKNEAANNGTPCLSLKDFSPTLWSILQSVPKKEMENPCQSPVIEESVSDSSYSLVNSMLELLKTRAELPRNTEIAHSTLNNSERKSFYDVSNSKLKNNFSDDSTSKLVKRPIEISSDYSASFSLLSGNSDKISFSSHKHVPDVISPVSHYIAATSSHFAGFHYVAPPELNAFESLSYQSFTENIKSEYDKDLNLNIKTDDCCKTNTVFNEKPMQEGSNIELDHAKIKTATESSCLFKPQNLEVVQPNKVRPLDPRIKRVENIEVSPTVTKVFVSDPKMNNIISNPTPLLVNKNRSDCSLSISKSDFQLKFKKSSDKMCLAERKNMNCLNMSDEKKKSSKTASFEIVDTVIDSDDNQNEVTEILWKVNSITPFSSRRYVHDQDLFGSEASNLVVNSMLIQKEPSIVLKNKSNESLLLSSIKSDDKLPVKIDFIQSGTLQTESIIDQVKTTKKSSNACVLSSSRKKDFAACSNSLTRSFQDTKYNNCRFIFYSIGKQLHKKKLKTYDLRNQFENKIVSSFTKITPWFEVDNLENPHSLDDETGKISCLPDSLEEKINFKLPNFLNDAIGLNLPESLKKEKSSNLTLNKEPTHRLTDSLNHEITFTLSDKEKPLDFVTLPEMHLNNDIQNIPPSTQTIVSSHCFFDDNLKMETHQSDLTDYSQKGQDQYSYPHTNDETKGQDQYNYLHKNDETKVQDQYNYLHKNDELKVQDQYNYLHKNDETKVQDQYNYLHKNDELKVQVQYNYLHTNDETNIDRTHNKNTEIVKDLIEFLLEKVCQNHFYENNYSMTCNKVCNDTRLKHDSNVIYSIDDDELKFQPGSVIENANLNIKQNELIGELDKQKNKLEIKSSINISFDKNKIDEILECNENERNSAFSANLTSNCSIKPACMEKDESFILHIKKNVFRTKPLISSIGSLKCKSLVCEFEETKEDGELTDSEGEGVDLNKIELKKDNEEKDKSIGESRKKKKNITQNYQEDQTLKESLKNVITSVSEIKKCSVRYSRDLSNNRDVDYGENFDSEYSNENVFVSDKSSSLKNLSSAEKFPFIKNLDDSEKIYCKVVTNGTKSEKSTCDKSSEKLLCDNSSEISSCDNLLEMFSCDKSCDSEYHNCSRDKNRILSKQQTKELSSHRECDRKSKNEMSSTDRRLKSVGTFENNDEKLICKSISYEEFKSDNEKKTNKKLENESGNGKKTDKKLKNESNSFKKTERKSSCERSSYEKLDRKSKSERSSYEKSDRKSSYEQSSHKKLHRKSSCERSSNEISDRKSSCERRNYEKLDRKSRGERNSYERSDRKSSCERSSYEKLDRKSRSERSSYEKSDKKSSCEQSSHKKLDRKLSCERSSYEKSDRKSSCDQSSHKKLDRKLSCEQSSNKKSDRKSSCERRDYEKLDKKSRDETSRDGGSDRKSSCKEGSYEKLDNKSSRKTDCLKKSKRYSSCERSDYKNSETNSNCESSVLKKSVRNSSCESSSYEKLNKNQEKIFQEKLRISRGERSSCEKSKNKSKDESSSCEKLKNKSKDERGSCEKLENKSKDECSSCEKFENKSKGERGSCERLENKSKDEYSNCEKLENKSKDERGSCEKLENKSKGEGSSCEKLRNKSKGERSSCEKSENKSKDECSSYEKLENKSKDERSSCEKLKNKSKDERSSCEKLKNKSKDERSSCEKMKNKSKGEHSSCEKSGKKSKDKCSSCEKLENKSKGERNSYEKLKNISKDECSSSKKFDNKSKGECSSFKSSENKSNGKKSSSEKSDSKLKSSQKLDKISSCENVCHQSLKEKSKIEDSNKKFFKYRKSSSEDTSKYNTDNFIFSDSPLPPTNKIEIKSDTEKDLLSPKNLSDFLLKEEQSLIGGNKILQQDISSKKESDLNVFQKRNREKTTQIKRKLDERDDQTVISIKNENTENFNTSILPKKKPSLIHTKQLMKEGGFLERRSQHNLELKEKARTESLLKSVQPITFIPNNPKSGLIYKKRYVNQLFVRGDNIIMVAYDKSL